MEGKQEKIQLNQKLVAIVGIAMSLWELAYASRVIVVESIIHRAIFLAFAFMLTFLIYPTSRKPAKGYRVVDWFFIGLGVASMVYFIFNYRNMLLRAGIPLPIDTIMGAIAIILVLEAARRTAGLPLAAIAAAFLFHAYFCNYLPGILHGRGFAINRIIEHLYMWAEGIFGLPLEVASTYIFMFIIFGAFFAQSGVGSAFLDLAFALFGGVRGGPAKVAIFGSAAFGTISGSAAASVATVGAFTIPMMKRIGYSPLFAGAVETVASTGGMIMPPIMAAAAFLIAEFLGIPYVRVMAMALVPACLYYFGLYWGIDAEACRLGLRGLPREELPNTKKVIKERWYLFIPIFLLIYILVGPRLSPMIAAFVSILAVIAVSWIRKDTRMGLRKILLALEDAAKQILIVATACAAAGIIVGSLSLTGLGMKLSTALISLSGGNVLLLLILVAVAAIILGMGLTPTAVYITLVVLLAPALEGLGISREVAHMFVFYFGCLSVITPPVAVAAYAAAGLTGENPLRTGFLAMKLALPIYIVPFTFAYSPVLLMLGSTGEIIRGIITASLATYAIATAGVGYHVARINWFFRVLLFAGGILLIIPEFITDLIGFLFVVVAVAYQYYQFYRTKVQEVSRN